MPDYDSYKELLEKKLDEYLEIKYPEKIWEAMRYSVLAGGKRLRPVLLLDVCNTLCGQFEHAVPAACALEMVHVYSLIHDDLPCMDNDDYRRGKLTNHKVFGEAMALLAGDSLLTYAPQLIIEKTPRTVEAKKLLKIVLEFTNSAGANGMVGGQVMDILSENDKTNASTLDYIHRHKTAELFKLAFRSGGILAGAEESVMCTLTELAIDFGNAFQIADDILDATETLENLGKTPGKDAQANKATYVNMYGLKKAKKRFNELCTNVRDKIIISHFKSDILSELIENIQNKINNLKGGSGGNN